MWQFRILNTWLGRPAILPPLNAAVQLTETPQLGDIVDEPDSEPEPISGFTCVIDYNGESRLITCRRYNEMNEDLHIGAICHRARGYRQFSCLNIEAVYDAQTGELLGDGNYFSRYTVEPVRPRKARAKAPSWGIDSGKKSHLVAGLNALAFMARCDGEWHNLETEAMERFVISMWLRKGWAGEPDLRLILEHAGRLAPDSTLFFKTLQRYATSNTSKQILLRAVHDLIAADGRICSDEMNWASEISTFFNEYSDAEYERFVNQR